MSEYPEAVLEKAQRLEQLLLRVEAGESLDDLNEELGFDLDREDLARKKEDESLRAPQLAEEIEEKFGVKLSAGHINYLLRKRGLTALPGRPPKEQPPDEEAAAALAVPNAPVDNAGIFFPRSGKGGAGSD